MSDCPVQVDDFATLFLSQAMVAAVVLGDTDPPNHIEKLRGLLRHISFRNPTGSGWLKAISVWALTGKSKVNTVFLCHSCKSAAVSNASAFLASFTRKEAFSL